MGLLDHSKDDAVEAKPSINKLAEQAAEKFSRELCDVKQDTKVVYFKNTKIINGKDGVSVITFTDDFFIFTKELKEKVWNVIYDAVGKSRGRKFVVLIPQNVIGAKKSVAKYNTYPMDFDVHKVYIVKGLKNIEVLDVD